MQRYSTLTHLPIEDTVELSLLLETAPVKFFEELMADMALKAPFIPLPVFFSIGNPLTALLKFLVPDNMLCRLAEPWMRLIISWGVLGVPGVVVQSSSFFSSPSSSPLLGVAESGSCKNMC